MADGSDTNSDDAKREQLLEAVIADFIRACETGTAPDRREILERHPELADELCQFFVQRDRMNQMVEPIRGVGDTLPLPVGPGQHVSYLGNYELLGEIARGGMGVVYKARQTTLGRIVAVKMIKAGRLASEDDVKRFQVEARAAASLQHPSIVSIHEVGQHEGWHYFSMDYVEGRDLSTILRENLLPAKQAATYVRQMAEAIHYAHQHGVLHRDLKPSNILIDSHDQIHITDFGLAMRVEDNNELTRPGEIVGTPSYMPPEQAQGQRSLIGPGSDVYSLGAILYECLTGRAPFRADSVMKTIDQVIHVEAASPRLLNPGLARDLETICLKCLQKEPHRRYGTAQLLADDLQRFLQDQPILARPLGTAEKFWRKCRQNPTVTGLIATVAVCLVAGTSVSTYFAIDANARASSETTLRQTADRERGIADTQKTLAIAARKRSAESLKDALGAVELMLTRVAQEKLVNVPQMEPVRKELMEDALKFYQKFLLQNNDDPLIRRETAGAHRRLADIYRRLGRNVEAEECYRKAFEMFGELERQSALEPSIRSDLAEAHFEVATSYRDLDRPSEGEKHSRIAVEIAEALATEFPEDFKYIDALVVAATHLSGAITSTRPDEAETILRRNLTLARSDYSVRQCNRFLGDLFASQGRYSEAEPLLRKSLEMSQKVSEDQPSNRLAKWLLSGNLLALEGTLAEQGQLEEAEVLLNRAIAICDKLAAEYPEGPDYRNAQGWAYDSLALLTRKLNRTAEAEKAHRRCLAIFMSLAADFPTTPAFAHAAIHQHNTFGRFLEELGRSDDAKQIYRAAVELAENRVAAAPQKSGDRRVLAQTYLHVAQTLVNVGRWEDGEKTCRLALGSYTALVADFPDEPSLRQNLANCEFHLARALTEQLRFPEAIQAYQRRVEVLKNLATDFPASRDYRYLVAEASFHVAVWSRATQPIIAEAAYREALSMMLALSVECPEVHVYNRETAHYRTDLADFLLHAGRLDEAESLARSAVDWGSGIPENSDAETRNVVGMAYRTIGGVMRAKSRFQEAEHAFRTSGGIFTELANELPPWNREVVAHSHKDLAGVIESMGRNEQASQEYDLSCAAWRKLAEDFPRNREYRLQLARIAFAIGNRLRSTQPQTAELRFREALSAMKQLSVEHPDVHTYGFEAANYRTALVDFLVAAGRLDEAESLTPNAVAHVLAQQGRFEDAAAAFSRAIEMNSEDLAGIWLPLALLHLKTGRFDEYRRLVSNALDRFGATEDRGVAAHLGVLAKLAPGSADDVAAVLKIVERALTRNPDDGFATAIRAHLLIRTGHADQGVPILEAAVAAGSDGQSDQRFNLLFLALGQQQLGRQADALATLRTAEGWQFKQFNGWLNQIDFERTRDEVESLLVKREVHLTWFPRFSPDGKWLLCAHGNWDPNEGGEARLFAVKDGSVQHVFKHRRGVRSVAWSSQSEFFVTGGFDNIVRFFDPKSGRLLSELDTGADVQNVRLSPDDKLVITSSASGDVRVFDLPSQKERHVFKAVHKEGIWGMAISPSGKLIATTGQDAVVRIFELDSFSVMHEFRHPKQTNGVAFAPDGRFLATGCADSIIRIFDVNTGEELSQYRGHTNNVLDLQFNTDATLLVSGGADRFVRLWDVSNIKHATLSKTLRGHDHIVFGVAISPDDGFLASAGWDDRVILRDLGTGVVLWTWKR